MAETFRKALVEVLVPEIRELRQETHESIAALRKDMDAGFTGLRQETAQLRKDMDAGFTGLRQETSQLRKDMDAGFTGLRQETSQLRQEVVQLRQGQELILERLDVLPRMARLETLFEQHLKAS